MALTPATASPSPASPSRNAPVATRLARSNILAIQLKRIGDAILTAPALAAAKAAYPGAQITLALNGPSATLAARPRLAITVDSAASHLAAMAKTPQTTLFGPANPVQWHPRHDRAITLQGAGGEPFKPSSRQPSRHPMAELSTASVIRAIGTGLNR